MGLNFKQVSSDDLDYNLDWSQALLQSAGALAVPKPPPPAPPPNPTRRQQQQLQPPEPLNCPRCGSTNTKFCYYNNYNKSQPRHFCKACKRHWTKGGTLRNVPVGGARKNKRLRTSITAAPPPPPNTATSSSSPTSARYMLSQSNLQDLHHQKNISDVLLQALLCPSSAKQDSPFIINSTTDQEAFDQNGERMKFGFSSSLSSINYEISRVPSSVIPASSSSQSPSLSAYDFVGKLDSMEESTITTADASRLVWQQGSNTSSSTVIDMANYWNWNDMDTLVSGDDFISTIPWEDKEIKP